MCEEFIGGGVFFGRARRADGARGLAGAVLGFEAVFKVGPDCLGRDNDAAATLDLRADGPFDVGVFLVAGALSASIAAMVL